MKRIKVQEVEISINSTEFGGIRNEAGTNRFLLSVKQWATRLPFSRCAFSAKSTAAAIC